jgi:hypothetical protein
LLVPVAATGINGLYKPGLKTFFPPVVSESLVCSKLIDEGWPQQYPRMKDLESGERGTLNEFEGSDCIIDTELGFTSYSLRSVLINVKIGWIERKLCLSHVYFVLILSVQRW